MSYWDRLKITSNPGKRKAPKKGASTNHRGMDVVFNDGKVRPEVGGTVYYSGNMDGYGNIIIIQGDDGNFYHYAHNAANRVKKGQRVKPNEVIATMGATGVATAPHTHIEVTDSRGNNLHPQTKKSLGIGGNKLASQGFYTGAAAQMMGGAAQIPQQELLPLGNQVYVERPQLLDPTQDIGNIGTGILQSNEALAAQHRAMQDALAKEPRYDIGLRSKQADEAIQALQEQALEDVNQQMYRGVLDPRYMSEQIANAYAQDELARRQAQSDLNTIYQDYQNRRDAQAQADFINQQEERMRQNFIASDPILRQYYQSGGNPSVNGYYIDPGELARRQQMDIGYDNLKAELAADIALQGHPDVANIYMQQRGQNPLAQQYLNQAEQQYRANLSNQYGIPYEQLMQQAKTMADYQKAYAPNQMAAYKDVNAQPEQNFRTVTEKMVPAITNMQDYKTRQDANYINNLVAANKNYIAANEPGANLINKATEQRGDIYQRQPERVLEKYVQESKALGIPTTPQIQGQTAIGGDVIQNTTRAAENLNKVQQELYNTEVKQGLENEKNLAKAYETLYGKPKATTPRTPEELATQDTEKVAKLLISPLTSKLDQQNIPLAVEYLMSTGRYSDQEIADKIKRLFPAPAKKKGKIR